MDNKLIYYLCDRTACAVCDPDCKHTSNIAHAKNFTPTGAGFIEHIEELPATPENATIIGTGFNYDLDIDTTRCKILGNVHDNPELLEA